MECKFSYYNSAFGLYHLIKVEPYWNVNIIEVKSNLNYTNIKVEPYWNVNITHFNPSILGISIKVEPYWNVNKNQEFKNKEIQDN